MTDRRILGNLHEGERVTYSWGKAQAKRQHRVRAYSVLCSRWPPTFGRRFPMPRVSVVGVATGQAGPAGAEDAGCHADAGRAGCVRGVHALKQAGVPIRGIVHHS
jgi:hypothetical protein